MKGIAVLVAAVAVIAAGLVSTPDSAQAAVGGNPYIDVVRSNTACNTVTHRMGLAASIVLSPFTARNGAYVSFNFAFYQVNDSGVRTSPFYYHNGSSISTNPNEGWSRPVFMNSTQVYSNPFTPGGGGTISNPVDFTGGTVNWSGRVQTQINVAVGGTQTGWLRPTSYQNFWPDSTGGHWANLTDCYLSTPW
jgi:hypothetical protein